MSELERIIDEYHALFTDEKAGETWNRLEQAMRARHLVFGDRMICTVLRPHFLTPAQYDYIRAESYVLLGAFERAYRALLASPDLRRQLHLTPDEEYVISLDPGYDLPTVSSRIDCFLTLEGSFQSVEYNAESPAGIAYTDVLTEAFLDLPVMAEFARRYQVKPLYAVPHQLEAMLDTWRAWGGPGLPHIAIVDWAGVPTTNEFHLFQEYFRQRGIESLIISPDEMTYENGRLMAAGGPVDLVYKRVLISELLAKYGTEHPIIYAVRDHSACMVNGFRCKLLHKKSIYAILSDERNQGIFTLEQQRAIREHIPWTRRVEERRTLAHGQEVELIPYIIQNQNNLVLKPNDEYGGKGVVIGWEILPQDWAQAVQEGLSAPTIVQEKVNIAYEPFGLLTDGHFTVEDRLVDLDPYLFEGREFYGILTRLSSVTLLNVTAGGGSVVPTLVVQPK